MVGWHHRLNGHEFAQTPADSEGQGSLTFCSPWGHKESDSTEQQHRAFQAKAAEYAFFSSEHGTCTRTDHILSHKASLDKFKKTEIISGIFSNHNAMRLETNYKRKTVKQHGG